MKNLILYIAFLISATLLFMNRYTDLYINNSIVHFILLVLASITFIFILGQAFGKLKTTKSKLFTIVIIGIVCFIHSFLTWGGDWKTQTILYRNISNDNRTVEFQMRGDRFSFGYKKRIINRLKLVPGFDWTTAIDTAAINHKEWQKQNIYVNEMQFASK
ncbi:hypothetical protein GJU43_20425 [Flavobacterium sp. LC2016-23]|uniref:hypothetical protein n=1 Tax=Flavobacterium sp. LC2016-23 TaxID=2666330 RepID=UPI0012AF5680|nr:hypothetical protein [Flavobacterium sp. LC2016-23]MRX41656.1 hypothetical protein [Flavobacterium sp. LC2016-23]